MSVICPNKNTKAFKSWLNAGISEEDIYTEFVLNNYYLPEYSEDINRALTYPEIKAQIENYKSLEDLGIKSIQELKHAHLGALGAFWKDTIYYSSQSNKKIIAEEIGHAMLQKYVIPESHSKIMEYGKELLTQRLKKESRTLNQYLESIQKELKVSKVESELYAYEEEFMKDFAIYETTGNIAQDQRNIQELAQKFSILGPLAETAAKIWYNIIKGLKILFNNSENNFELIRSLKDKKLTENSRGYSKPSYVYIPKAGVGFPISPIAIQKFINDVTATLYRTLPEIVNYEEFLKKLEEAVYGFSDYYSDLEYDEQELAKQENRQEYISELDRDLSAMTEILEYDRADNGNSISPKDFFIQEVRDSLKDLGIKVGKRLEDDTDVDLFSDEDKQILETSGTPFDKSANEYSPESLSLGLKTIILKTGKSVNQNGVELVFAPDQNHIYSGLVRFSANSLDSNKVFKSLVEFADNPDNISTNLLVKDYFLANFVGKATYEGKKLNSVEKWVEAIQSIDNSFDINKIEFLEPNLASEFITLIKSMSLVTRNQETMVLKMPGSEGGYVGFNSFKTNLNDATDRTYKNLFSTVVNNFNKLYVVPIPGKTKEDLIIKHDNLEAESISYSKDPALSPVKQSIENDIEFFVSILSRTTYIKPWMLKKITSSLPKEMFDGTLRRKFIDNLRKNKDNFGKDQNSTLGILREVAKILVKYDESILDNSFQNMSDKTIYAYQRTTPIINFLSQLGLKNNNDYWMSHLQNPIEDTYSRISEVEKQKITPFSLDGMFSELDNSKKKKRIDEVPFAKMDGRAFSASIINLMLNKAKFVKDIDENTNLFLPTTLGQNEASNLIDFFYSPIIKRDVGLTTIVQQEVNRRQQAINFMENFFQDKVELAESNSNTLKATYDELVQYGKENNIPIYKGYLEGEYTFDINADKKLKIISSDSKALTLSRNLDGIITLNDTLILSEEKLLEKANKNYNTLLNEQYDKLEKEGVLEIVNTYIKKGTVKDENSKVSDEMIGFNTNMFTNESKEIILDQKERIKKVLEQFWYSATFANQALVGDPMVSFKNDLKDIFKRHRIYNAAINSLEIPYDVPSLNISVKKDINYVIINDTVEEVLDKNVEVDDGQSYSSMQFWLEKTFTKGRLTPTRFNLWKKSQAGEEVTVKEIKNNGYYIGVQKTVGAQNQHAIKHAEYTILPKDVAKVTRVDSIPNGYYFENGILKPNRDTNFSDIYVGYINENDEEIINILEALPERIDLWNKYLIVNGFKKETKGYSYLGNIDILTPETTQKAAKANVTNVKDYHTNPEYYRQSISANNYGDQVEVPQGHEDSIDPTQNREVKVNEFTTTEAKKLVDDFIKNESERNTFEVDFLMKILYGPEYKDKLSKDELEKDTKEFYGILNRILKATGASQQTIDFSELEGEVAKYNQNLPIIRQKFTQILFKLFTRALKHRVAGDSMVQVSKSGHNLIKKLVEIDGTVSWKTVTREEYEADENRSNLEDLSKLKYDGRAHKDNKPTELIDRLKELKTSNKGKTTYFIDEIRFMKPYYQDGNFKFYTSETLMPRWYNQLGIDDNLTLQYSVRIPTADKQSSVVIEWVGELSPEQGNSIIVPKEVVVLSGSDFDVDKLFTQRAEGYFVDGKFKKYDDSYEDFRKYMFDNKSELQSKLTEAKESDSINGKAYQKFTKEKEDIKNKIKLNSYYLDLEKEKLSTFTPNLRAILNSNLNNKFISSSIFKIFELNKILNTEDVELYVDTLEEKNKILQRLYDNTGLKEIKEILDFDQEQLSDFYDTSSGLFFQLREAKKTLNKIEFSIQDKILEDLGYEKTGNIYPALLNNEQLDRSIELLSQEEILDVYLTPSSIDPFKKTFENFSFELTSGPEFNVLERQIENLKNNKGKKLEEQSTDIPQVFVEKVGSKLKVKPFMTPDGDSKFLVEDSVTQQFSVNNMLKYQNDVKTGKESIGLIANANVLGIYAKRYNVFLSEPILFEKEKLSNITFKTVKEKRVFDAIASTISAVVDEAKEAQLANHGITVEDLKVMSTLLLHGFDVEDAIAFVQSPGAKRYKEVVSRDKFKPGKQDYTGNQERINKELEGAKIDDMIIRRSELIDKSIFGLSNDTNTVKKYISMYATMLHRYNELSQLIPIVKIKAGISTTVEDVQKAIQQVETLKDDKARENMLYNYDQLIKSSQFKEASDFYNTVNKVSKAELIEMSPFFTSIKSGLESSIKTYKREYSEKINEYIDKFLFGQKLQSKQPGLISRADELEKNIIDTIEEYKSKVSNSELTDIEKKIIYKNIRYIDNIIKISEKEKGDKTEKSIGFAYDGKLTPQVQLNINNAYLILKNSNDDKLKQLAEDLFDFYVIKSGLHWTPGSFEPVFPASNYEQFSKYYEEILKDEYDENIIQKFYKYFISATEDRYIESQSSLNDFIGKGKYTIIRNNNEISSIKILDSNLELPIAFNLNYMVNDVEVDINFVLDGDTYNRVDAVKESVINPMLYNDVIENPVKDNEKVENSVELTIKPLFTIEKAKEKLTYTRNSISHKLEFVDVIPTKKETPVGMSRNKKTGVISIVENAFKNIYNTKKWTNPSLQSDGSKATALPENQFKTLDEFFTFALLHEVAHSYIFKNIEETIGQYVDRINEEALKQMELSYGFKKQQLDNNIQNNKVELYNGFWTREEVAKQTDKVFLFGDNTDDRVNTKYIPTSTQAVIRGLPNAIGIDTKKNRGTTLTEYYEDGSLRDEGSYFTNDDFEIFKQQVDEAIQKAKDSDKTIVIPADGIGTGKAMLKEKAPKLFEYLQQELNKLKTNQTETNTLPVETPTNFGTVEENNKVLDETLAPTYFDEFVRGEDPTLFDDTKESESNVITKTFNSYGADYTFTLTDGIVTSGVYKDGSGIEKPLTKPQKKYEELINTQENTNNFNENNPTKTIITDTYELFPGVFANKGQQEAITKMIDFLKPTSKERTFLLQGKGGVGKTTIINKVLKDTKESNKSLSILGVAPSHKAKKVLRNSVKVPGFQVKTLAAALSIKLDENTGRFQPDEFKRSKGDIPIGRYDVIVIDESSMVSDKLLEEILQFVGPKSKIIFMGDRAQLPPVGQEEDSKVFSLTNTLILTEKMRQAATSPIISIGTIVGENAENENRVVNPIKRDMRRNAYDEISDSSLIFLKDENDFIDAYIDTLKEDRNNVNHVKMITFNNENNTNSQSVKSLNNKIRNKLYNNPQQFEKGEILTSYSTFSIGDPEDEADTIFNADDFIVLDSKELKNTTIKVIATSKAKGTREITKVYDIVMLKLKNDTGQEVGFQVPVISESSKAQYTKDLADLYKSDTQLALKLSEKFANLQYGYAITSHKAQGSTYKNAFVLEDNIMGPSNGGTTKSKNQSLYVAISRPSTNLTILSEKNNLEEDPFGCTV